MPGVLLSFHLYGNAWTVHFIEIDAGLPSAPEPASTTRHNAATDRE